jgi:hypothetical protein
MQRVIREERAANTLLLDLLHPGAAPDADSAFDADYDPRVSWAARVGPVQSHGGNAQARSHQHILSGAERARLKTLRRRRSAGNPVGGLWDRIILGIGARVRRGAAEGIRGAEEEEETVRTRALEAKAAGGLAAEYNEINPSVVLSDAMPSRAADSQRGATRVGLGLSGKAAAGVRAGMERHRGNGEPRPAASGHGRHPKTPYSGWLSASVVRPYVRFVDLAMRLYGDKIRHWVTLHDPYKYCSEGYGTGMHAPGRCSDRARCKHGDSGREPYVCLHNSLLAHTYASVLFNKHYRYVRSACIYRQSCHLTVPSPQRLPRRPPTLEAIHHRRRRGIHPAQCPRGLARAPRRGGGRGRRHARR